MALRRTFILEHPTCTVCVEGCRSTPVQIHHKHGRRGNNYLDVMTWISTCQHCHDYIHRNPEWATKNGFLGSFLK